MEEAFVILKNWHPPSDQGVKSRFRSWLQIGQSPTFVNIFRNRLATFPHDSRPYANKANSLASGLVCFAGGVLMSVSSCGNVQHAEELFLFTVVYLLSDYYLDDPSLAPREKQNMALELERLVLSPEGHFEHPTLEAISRAVRGIYSTRPQVKEWLHAGLKAELESVHIQKDATLNREAYLEIAERKGGLTTQVMKSIIDGNVGEGDYILGACVQLYDDLCDVEEDIEAGINTIATHDLRTQGNLDNLFYYTVEKVNTLPDYYTLFKPIFMALLTYLATRGKFFSSSLVERFGPLAIIDYRDGIDLYNIAGTWIRG